MECYFGVSQARLRVDQAMAILAKWDKVWQIVPAGVRLLLVDEVMSDGYRPFPAEHTDFAFVG